MTEAVEADVFLGARLQLVARRCRGSIELRGFPQRPLTDPESQWMSAVPQPSASVIFSSVSCKYDKDPKYGTEIYFNAFIREIFVSSAWHRNSRPI